MSGPWYVKNAWDRIYLMRHDLNPSTAQSECDRLNAEWEQAQVPVEVEPAKALVEPVQPANQQDHITVQKLTGKWKWAAVVCGKYAARSDGEERVKEIAADLRNTGKCCNYTWTNVHDEKSVLPKVVQEALDDAKKPMAMTIIDEDVKPGEPAITVDQDGPSCWRVIVNGKFYAPCATEKRIKEIAARVKAERSSAGYGWCSMETKTGVSSSLVDAEWPKLPVKEDIKTVVVNQDEKGSWRVVLNGKWEAKCGQSKETCECIEHDTLAGRPQGWTWHCLTSGNLVDLRTVLNLKG